MPKEMDYGTATAYVRFTLSRSRARPFFRSFSAARLDFCQIASQFVPFGAHDNNHYEKAPTLGVLACFIDIAVELLFAVDRLRYIHSASRALPLVGQELGENRAQVAHES